MDDGVVDDGHAATTDDATESPLSLCRALLCGHISHHNILVIMRYSLLMLVLMGVPSILQ